MTPSNHKRSKPGTLKIPISQKLINPQTNLELLEEEHRIKATKQSLV